MSKKNSKNVAAIETTVIKKDELRNAFGTLLSEETSKIDAALTETPKKMKQLMADSGAGGRSHYDHLNRLVRLGLIEKTPEGYKLLSTKTESAKKSPRKRNRKSVKKTQPAPQASA